MNDCLNVTVCTVKIGKCIFATCEHFFYFPLTHCDLIFFFFLHQTAKTNKQKKTPKKSVTRLLSFIFVLFTFLLDTIMFVMVTSNGKLNTVF